MAGDFVVGQRVRIRQFGGGWATPEMGDPHCIVGHFGHVKSVSLESSFIDIEISHGPNGGPIDPRILTANRGDGVDSWPMFPGELEAVD